MALFETPEGVLSNQLFPANCSHFEVCPAALGSLWGHRGELSVTSPYASRGFYFTVHLLHTFKESTMTQARFCADYEHKSFSTLKEKL